MTAPTPRADNFGGEPEQIHVGRSDLAGNSPTFDPRSQHAKTHSINPQVCRKLGLLPWHSGITEGVTLDQYKSAIRVRIAELEGITHAKELIESEAEELINSDIRDYCHDLNACHEFEEKLNPPKVDQDRERDDPRWVAYNHHLAMIVPMGAYVHATALQRCEARILIEP